LPEFGYKYISQIGKGTFGNVHLIFSQKYNQYFVLKQNIKTSRFEIINEFELLKRLFHPNIIYLYSMIDLNSTICIVLEYCSGGTLKELIESNGPIKPPRLYRYCYQILLAIDYLHQNKIAHRDISASNILLDQHNRIKLIDFGLSQQITSQVYTDFCGSQKFLPPEVWNHMKGYDPFLVDIYSSGVIFYYLSQGTEPFSSLTREGLKRLILKGDIDFTNTDPLFEAMVRKMMSKDPKERPSTSQLLSYPFFEKIEAFHSHRLSLVAKNNQLSSKLNSHSMKYN
jgi:5'-AMP-activated protein kinase catalytic alpha subunit